MTRRWETALLAIAISVAGLTGFALAFSGAGTYAALARDEGFAPATFHYSNEGGSHTIERSVGLPDLIEYHERWVAYVTGRAATPPSDAGPAAFTTGEYAHMADVRRVFIAFQFAAVVGIVVGVVVIARAASRGPRPPRILVRDAAVAAGVGTAIIATAAAAAFDPLFLLFHEVFFPQGNFLFPPDSNLIAMYPDPYWYGVTIRVGLTFVVVMAVTAIAATATLRQVRR